MEDRIVLDSSVIAAVFFKEEASERAESFAERNYLITVDLAAIEVATVAWKRINFFGEDKELMQKALDNCLDFINTLCEVIAAGDIVGEAFEIASIENITIYDALFVAASEIKGARLITADRKLHNKIKNRRKAELI